MDLIERLQMSAEHVRSTSKGGMEYEARLMEEAAAALAAQPKGGGNGFWPEMTKGGGPDWTGFDG